MECLPCFRVKSELSQQNSPILWYSNFIITHQRNKIGLEYSGNIKKHIFKPNIQYLYNNLRKMRTCILYTPYFNFLWNIF